MRKIKFRGKRANGEWVFGNLLTGVTDRGVRVSFIAPKLPIVAEAYDLWGATMYRIEPNSVGQFTGLVDRAGREIYEGDIIMSKDYPKHKHLIFYNDVQGLFMAGLNGNTNVGDFGVCSLENTNWLSKKTVVGNIHDNKELLEKGGKQ